MPRQEKALMDWIDGYITAAVEMTERFPEVFGETATFKITKVRILFGFLKNARSRIVAITDYLRSLVVFKNILAYATDHEVGEPVGEPVAPPPGAQTFPEFIGIVGMIDFQVRLLRESPGFDQTVAAQLGIIPRRPHETDPADFDLKLSARIVGAKVELRFRSLRGVSGASLVQIWCAHGNEPGHLVGSTTRASFIDVEPFPDKRTVWTYTAWIVNDMGIRISPESEAKVIVGG